MSSPSPEEERVLAVRRDTLVNAGLHNGVTLGEAAGLVIRSILDQGAFLPRSQVERDASYLQPIPCAVVKAGSAFLTLRRHEVTKKAPLHGRYVIWIGGHVRLEDSTDTADFLMESLSREVEEELAVRPHDFAFKALIVPPGALHFAIVHESLISEALIDDVTPNSEFLTPKSQKKEARFRGPRQLLEMSSRLDLWSRLILDEIYWYGRNRQSNPQLKFWPR